MDISLAYVHVSFIIRKKTQSTESKTTPGIVFKKKTFSHRSKKFSNLYLWLYLFTVAPQLL